MFQQRFEVMIRLRKVATREELAEMNWKQLNDYAIMRIAEIDKFSK